MGRGRNPELTEADLLAAIKSAEKPEREIAETSDVLTALDNPSDNQLLRWNQSTL